jgi:SagB-type dehydrogenase family enzyme
MKSTLLLLALVLLRPLAMESIHMKLPTPRLDSQVSIETALHERRSFREYTKAPITLADLAQLLWAAQGVTAASGFRTAPSAGALYPLEVYLLAGNVEDLPAGIYRYHPPGHTLSRVAAGDARRALMQVALDQSSLHDAATVILLAAVYERTTAKYGTRGVRYVYMEAGHAAQNVYLQGEGRTLVIVKVEDSLVSRVQEILQRHRAVNVAQREA